MEEIEEWIVNFIHSTSCIECIHIPHLSRAKRVSVVDFIATMADRYAPYVELTTMYSPWNGGIILTMKRRTP